MYRLDRRDVMILSLLVENSRLSYREIARKTGLSSPTVIKRIQRLEEEGIIKRYTVEIDYSKLGYNLPVIIDVRVARGKLFEVEKQIASHPNVLAVYDITGEFDVSVIALFKGREDLDAFVKELQRIKYVERTYTKIILNVIKDERNSLLE